MENFGRCSGTSPVRKILIVCPQCDGNDVGENLCGFQWTSRLARIFDVTVLTQKFPRHVPPSQQLKGVRTIEWDAKPFLSRHPRFNSAVKPWYPNFYFRARHWIKEALAGGERFDLLHQIMPMAIRYPSPCAGFDVPFVIGPVGGGVATPAGFRCELGTEPRFMRLREFDRFRLRHDPLLRRTYQEAQSIICCSPYVVRHLDGIAAKRIDVEYEVGIEELPQLQERNEPPPGTLKLLYVGRIVRTKGLRDAVRALAQLQDLPNVTLEAAGSGEDMDDCMAEAERLGVASRVRFLGRLPRAELEPIYQGADVLLFPSFREPTGGVLFEAMRYGMPVITSTEGGPGHIVTEACGVTVRPTTPLQYATDIASAIRRLAKDVEMRRAMGLAARERIAELGLWERKLARLSRIYEAVIASARHNGVV